MTSIPFHALTLLEEGMAGVLQLWSVMQEAAFMASIIWFLNQIVHLAGKTYQAGRVVGKFYFDYCHEYVVTASRWLWTEGTKYLGLLCYLIYLGARVIYENRREILEKIEEYRETVSQAFTYRY